MILKVIFKHFLNMKINPEVWTKVTKTIKERRCCENFPLSELLIMRYQKFHIDSKETKIVIYAI